MAPLRVTDGQVLGTGLLIEIASALPRPSTMGTVVGKGGQHLIIEQKRHRSADIVARRFGKPGRVPLGPAGRTTVASPPSRRTTSAATRSPEVKDAGAPDQIADRRLAHSIGDLACRGGVLLFRAPLEETPVSTRRAENCPRCARTSLSRCGSSKPGTCRPCDPGPACAATALPPPAACDALADARSSLAAAASIPCVRRAIHSVRSSRISPPASGRPGASRPPRRGAAPVASSVRAASVIRTDKLPLGPGQARHPGFSLP